jgi:hypothetical protein
MDDEDAERLILELQKRFRELGEPQLADQDSYIVDHPEIGRKRLRPRERLAQMLEAFERTMSLDDEATRRASLDLIARATHGEVPEIRVVPYDEETGEPSEPFHFVHLHRLSDLRQRLTSLAEMVRYGEFDRGIEE